ncbi:hypothetical protein ACTFIW_011271 [Dictyostelium discoideum]
MSKQIEKIEKELPTVSFTTNKDSKKYRDKKRKERQIKKEKGIKVNKIKKQVYNSDSEDEKDSDEDEIEDEFASLSEEEEEKEKEKVVENKKQKTSSSNEPVNRFELDKEALSNKLSSILAHGTSTKKQKQTTTTTADGSTILSKSEQTLNETIKKEKEKNKQEKERQLEKELLQTKDYKPIEILLTPEERDLMRLAKKGVIKLFNAVTQHQQSGLTASVDQKSKNITKNQFLENLKNTKVKKANDDDDEDDYSDDDYSDDQKDGEQWDVLKDDYLVKNEYDIKEEQD